MFMFGGIDDLTRSEFTEKQARLAAEARLLLVAKSVLT
jgi:hypothetical protein